MLYIQGNVSSVCVLCGAYYIDVYVCTCILYNVLLCAVTQMIPSFCVYVCRLTKSDRLCVTCVSLISIFFSGKCTEKPTKNWNKRKMRSLLCFSKWIDTKLDRILHRKEIKNETLAYHEQNEHLIIWWVKLREQCFPLAQWEKKKRCIWFQALYCVRKMNYTMAVRPTRSIRMHTNI